MVNIPTKEVSESYTYWWNVPSQGIPSPYLTHEQQRRRDREIAALLRARTELAKQPDCVRYDINRRVDYLERTYSAQRANAHLVTFVRRALPRLERVAGKYSISGIDSNLSRLLFGGRFDSPEISFFASRLINMTARYNRLQDMSRADIELLAGDVANYITGEIGVIEGDVGTLKVMHQIYMRAAIIAQHFRCMPPLWERVTTRLVSLDDIAPAVLRMTNEKWWRGRLRRVAAEWREHLQIALGNVSKKNAPYASKACIADWREQKRRTREFLKGMDLQDDEGNRISLIDKYDGSVANPPIRRGELMTRISGFEKISNELGYVGEFYTITAPSKYHATTKAGYRNTKWNGASPADTQSYLSGVWSRIRAKLHRQDVRIFGIRVAEPHHDGTPHWHMLIFMMPQDVECVRAVMQEHAHKEDAAELLSAKARKARFHAEAIDPEKGSATGYVAKYISKNIDGFALDDERDDESGELLKETAPAVAAWAARWRIRQFQFIGGAPVTVYRELRKMADTETAHGLSVEFAAVHDAADGGRWADYVNAQGGPFVRRDDLQVRTWYEPTETLNEYGEECVRIKGVFDTTVGMDSPILTRLVQWKIVPKLALDLDVDLKGDPSPSRSSVNNCTGDILPTVSPPPVIDLTRRLNRAEKRRLSQRIRAERPARKKDGAWLQPYDRETLAKTADNVKEMTGETISQGAALYLMKGGKMRIGTQWCHASTKGIIFSAEPPSTAPRIARLMQRIENLSPGATKNVLHDPFGKYENMLKKADPDAHKLLFESRTKRRQLCLTSRSVGSGK
ncbi:replication endonuclease [Dryocola sp. BD626]|uniref:replication endonuclease n=1 Tax=Dryocola sp. BD626 TaxID=3133273 RepID=UPI003F4FD2DB